MLVPSTPITRSRFGTVTSIGQMKHTMYRVMRTNTTQLANQINHAVFIVTLRWSLGVALQVSSGIVYTWYVWQPLLLNACNPFNLKPMTHLKYRRFYCVF